MNSQEAYYQEEALSQSKLKLIKTDPFEYYRRYILGAKQEETAALRFGKIIDEALTEPKKYAQYQVKPGVKTTSAPGYITETEQKQIARMIANLESFPMMSEEWQKSSGDYITFGEIMRKCEKQVILRWIDTLSGEKFKGKLDFLLKLPNNFTIFDLKSTRESTLEGFIKSINQQMYHLQHATYCIGVKDQYELDYYPEFWFIGISKVNERVFAVKGSEEDLELGIIDVNNCVSKYQRLQKENSWAIPEKPVIGYAGYWMKKDILQELQIELAS